MEPVAVGKAADGVRHPIVCRAHAKSGTEHETEIRVDRTGVPLGQYPGNERRGPGDACPQAGVQGEIPGAGEEEAHFPPVTAGMTKDANGLNQKNGRRRETGQEKVCRCAPSTAL